MSEANTKRLSDPDPTRDKVRIRNTTIACHLNGEECCVDQLWRGHREGGIADNAENCRVRFLFSKECAANVMRL